MNDDQLLYLSAADVAAVNLAPAAAQDAILSMFRAHHGKRTVGKPKLSIDVGPGHAFQSLCAAAPDLPSVVVEGVPAATPDGRIPLPLLGAMGEGTDSSLCSE